MKCLKLGLLALVLGAPANAFAQPDPDYVDRYDSSVAGEPVASVDVFYDQLSPYGMWVDDPDFGQVFIPEHKQFVPYTQGHWQYTSVGFVWTSSEPFDWATAHYGRWAYSRSYGRWLWRPDTVWGPSWVEWRQSGDDFGWAPLAPQVAVSVGYTPPAESWHYCGAAHVLDANVSRYYEPPSRVIEIHREARPIEHYAQISGARVVVGPSAATLHEHHVTARPIATTAIALHATGRLAPTEARAAVTHAQEHHAANEVQNRKRIESNPAVFQVQARVAVATPHRADGSPAAAPPQVKQEPKPPQGQPEHKQPQVQPQPRQPTQPEHKQPQVQPQPRPQVRQEPKQEPKPQVRQEPKQEPKPQIQPQPRQPAPPEHKQPQVQPQPRQPAPPEHKQPQAQPEPKPQVRQEPKQSAPPEHKQPQAQPEPKPQVRQEPKQPAPPEHKQPQAQPEPKPQVRQEPKQEPKPQVREEPKQEPKPSQPQKEPPSEADRKRDQK